MASTFASLGLIQAGSRAPDQRIFLESEHIIIINNNNDNINNNNSNNKREFSAQTIRSESLDPRTKSLNHYLGT